MRNNRHPNNLMLSYQICYKYLLGSGGSIIGSALGKGDSHQDGSF